jgi:integrase
MTYTRRSATPPIAELVPQTVLAVLRQVEARGAIHTAYRIKIIIGQICRYAVVTGRATNDPCSFLKPEEVLQQAEVKHHAAIIDPKQLKALLLAIDNYEGTFIVKCALQLAPLFFLRPGELQKMEWAEVDFENAQTNIPAARMKMKQPHIVPLSKQAIVILKSLHQVTGSGKYLFAGRTSVIFHEHSPTWFSNPFT